MSSPRGPIDIECDAPPYPIVAACQDLGFQAPLDVRWYRLRPFLRGRRGGLFGFHPLQWLFGSHHPPGPACTCGQPLPRLEHYTFTPVSKREAYYLLGQCRRCRTMFWEEASAPSG
jgi:hypothetical protein